MPSWVWVVIGILATLVVLGAAGYLAWGAWRRYERQTVVGLISRREALRSSRQSFAETLAFLAAADDEQLEEFAADPDELHRRVLGDVTSRARILQDELDTMPLPSALTPVAESLADAAWMLAEEAGRVGWATPPDQALAWLGDLDLEPLNRAFADADADVERVKTAFEVEDQAVYGGGLYV